MIKKPFTEEEVKFLIDNCETMTRKQLAQAIGRSTPTVTQKLLRINKNPMTFKAQSSNTWVKMFQFCKSLNPKYEKVTDAFNDYGKEQFIKLYKAQA